MTVENQAIPNSMYAAVAGMLERLAGGESLESAGTAMGLGGEEVGASLLWAAAALRKAAESQLPLKARWPARGTLLDWREMTVAEALEVLADHAIGGPDAKEPD